MNLPKMFPSSRAKQFQLKLPNKRRKIVHQKKNLQRKIKRPRRRLPQQPRMERSQDPENRAKLRNPAPAMMKMRKQATQRMKLPRSKPQESNQMYPPERKPQPRR